MGARAMTPPRDPVEPHDRDPTAERLLRALNQALEGGEPIARHTVLHDAVCEYVHTLRERGLAPELALIDVKQLLRKIVNVYVADSRRGNRWIAGTRTGFSRRFRPGASRSTTGNESATSQRTNCLSPHGSGDRGDADA
jgi:hypothetical protein